MKVARISEPTEQKYLPEAVERPPVQVEAAVRVFRLAIVVFTHTVQLTNIDSTNLSLDTPLNDVLAETEKKCVRRSLHFAWSRVALSPPTSS
uniref:Uncharacterized protein n=1 Tax=uncultured haloarchaeon TaxID=160804 RepID=A0A0K1YB73_9EURY|nr:hypothetical protein [uncultured haloarchaeon]